MKKANLSKILVGALVLTMSLGSFTSYAAEAENVVLADVVPEAAYETAYEAAAPEVMEAEAAADIPAAAPEVTEAEAAADIPAAAPEVMGAEVAADIPAAAPEVMEAEAAADVSAAAAVPGTESEVAGAETAGYQTGETEAATDIPAEYVAVEPASVESASVEPASVESASVEPAAVESVVVEYETGEIAAAGNELAENIPVVPEVVETEVAAPEAVQYEAAYYETGSGWKLDGDNWWYRYPSGYYPQDCWDYIDGSWYHFDSDGNMETGWLYDNAWYYLWPNGIMATGWVWDGAWYYMGPYGNMLTGWIWDGVCWYYMGWSGAMVTGWLWDGAWYYLAPDGHMVTGWVLDGNNWYYLNSSGALQTGWIKDGGAKYYLNEYGIMVTGWLYQGGYWYYFDYSGKMVTGWLTFIGEQYYLQADGTMATGWIQEDGKQYYLEKSGELNLDKSYLGEKEFSILLPTSAGTQEMTRTLGYESEGSDVYYLQQKLADLGYLIAVPKGYYGNLTYDAVAAFQKDHGKAAPNGIADEWTMNQLSLSTSAQTKTVPDYEISPLSDSVHITDKNYDREDYDIRFIIPHHMAGKMTGENCANYFVNNGLSNSANYCIGYAGDISAGVPEDYGAWTSSWWAADEQAVTIEVSDEANGSIIIPNDAIESLIRLSADLIRRNPTIGTRMIYDPNDADIVIAAKQAKDPSMLNNVNGNVLLHNWTSGNTTSCPEQDMIEKLPIVADKVNQLLVNPNSKLDLSEFTAITERRKAEAEAKRKAEEEAKRKAEEEAARQAAEEE